MYGLLNYGLRSVRTSSKKYVDGDFYAVYVYLIYSYLGCRRILNPARLGFSVYVCRSVDQ